MSGRRACARTVALGATIAVGCGAAGCGTSTHAQARTTPAQPHGGTVLTYVAEAPAGAKADGPAIAKTVAVMRRRLALAGVHGAGFATSGTQLQVTIPAVKNAAEAQQLVGTTGQLAFYDWEPNVVGPDGRTAPTDQNVTGGQNAGNPGGGWSQSQYDAVMQASKSDPSNTTQGLWYGADKKTRRIFCGPQPSAAAARTACANAAKRPSSYAEVPQGYIVVQAQSDASDPRSIAAAADSYLILQDRPALSGKDIKNPERSTDQTVGDPTVTFDFTSSGRKKWRKLTRAIARRGTAALLPGVDPISVANHFAIVLDDKLISVPYIDPQQNPDGIDGSNGSQISGGFTPKTAQNLANLLKSGALPLHLELVAQRRTQP